MKPIAMPCLVATLLSPLVLGAQATVTFNPLVYRAAVAAVMGDALPDTVVVGPVSVRLVLPDEVVQRGGQVNERLHRYDDIPSGLPERLDALSITPHPVGELHLPPGFRVLDDSSAALLAEGEWRALRRRAPVRRGVVHLTPVAYDERAATALVGLIWDCGAGCRRLHAVWLVPDGTGGWRVQGTHRFPLT